MFLGKGALAAVEALKKLGVKEEVIIEYGASWTFAGFKGDHFTKEWVAEVTRPRYQGPAMISNMINTPAVDKGFCFFLWDNIFTIQHEVGL